MTLITMRRIDHASAFSRVGGKLHLPFVLTCDIPTTHHIHPPQKKNTQRYDQEIDIERTIIDRKARQQQQRKVLAQQRNATKLERDAATRADRYARETPVIADLGKSGSGAPNIFPDGTMQMKLAGKMQTDIMGGEKIPSNKKLGAALEKQMADTEYKRHHDLAYDRHYSLHLATKRWDPFTRPQLQSASLAKRPPFVTKMETLENNLITEMGKPGGGNPLSTARRAVNLPDEDYNLELKAQAAGKSGWNQAGSGAPNRNSDGTNATKLYGAAVMDKSGRTEHVKDPKYMQKIAAIKKEQDEFLVHKRANKMMRDKLRRQEAAKFAKAPKMADKMAASSDRRHKLQDVQRAHVKDPDPNFDPRAPPQKSMSANVRDREAGKALKKAQTERRQRAKKAREKTVTDDKSHIEAVTRTFEITAKREKEHAKHDKHKDRITKFLNPEMHPSDRSLEEKRAYAEVLQNDIKRVSENRKKFEKRRLDDEKEHAKYTNKFLGKSLPRVSKQANGEFTARRRIPVGGEAQEYRLLCNTAPALE